MTGSDDSERDRSGDEGLAAEYALGVLSLGDRKRIEARIEREPAFARMVAAWDDRLSPLEEAGEERPPATVYARIERQLFGNPADGGARAGWWRSLVLWRGLALASFAAFVASILLQSGLPVPGPASVPLVASMTGDAASVALMARYDAKSGRIDITPVAAGAAERHSLELWVIPGGGTAAPVSLGLLPQSGEGAVVVPAALRNQIAEGVVLAISLEPEGGSPTGGPTGPVVAAGPARHL